MKETISLRIAANDKLKLIEEKMFIEKISLAIIVIMIIVGYFGIGLQIGIILSLILLYFYKKDKKEHKRMRTIYAL